ncbi:hypothetical protein GUJ93_ZPchr0011g28717 [Zizania palustris]|uniref:DUF4220 domain-containing protein n=1 Tax=Zizania palustris TaxID=103762 RepID=A0A8J5WK01_ZIZPA|nr:hypothetical protein GUJ93_ZPchr0011g28717 [Zizania palustris]KAG8090261.1 hypothetical protein GUJ93_ZPchr0011g28717 [Zizania palustris]KAG8090262.1 hypothetical protein GUJ93_ZPchr0011g28717 [Zizania palustris]
MRGAEVVTGAWKEWGVQALVLLSLMVQVTLLVLAEFRRYIDSGVLRVFVWSAYMLADGTAIYVLGHLSVTTTRSPEHQLSALWAPFLLLHLGGQDRITAYAIEDNRLWLRHLQTLVVQVAAAVYVIYGSSAVAAVGGGDSPPLLLLSASVLMLVVGVVKYGERVWALRCAGSSPTGGGEYQSDIGKRRLSLAVPETFTSRRLDPAETLLLNAHLLLDFAKDRFKGPLPRLFLCGPMNQESQPRGDEELYMVAEMQLSLLHDVFYTKAEVTHTWYGLCVRLLSSLTTTVAFFLFNVLLLLGDPRRRQRKMSSTGADVVVTYVLFVGAVVLEAASLVRAMLSSWTCALLLKKGSERSKAAKACNFLARAPACLRRLLRAARWRRRRSWSRSMGQLNLVQLCVRSRASRWSKAARRIRVEDWWNLLAYSGPTIPVSPCIQQLLLTTIKGKQWGQEELESRGLYSDRAWLADSKIEQRILIWHIATDIYLRWYKDQDQDPDEEQAEAAAADLVETAQALSNYMMFLLASRPHMLPPDAGRNDYLVLCYAITRHLRYTTADDLLGLLRRYADALSTGNSSEPEFKLTCTDTNQLGDKALRGGCSLAAFLIHHQQQQQQPDAAAGVGTLEMICQVWAQTLCYAGEQCSTSSHVKQLSSGGELLTVAALVAKYMRSIRLSSYFHIDLLERPREW